MIKYLNEEDIEMDVQVGPKDEIDVSANPEEAAPTQTINPVDIAKSAPENIPVAVVKSDDQNDAGNEEKLEFYVDARDVEKYADLNEFTMIEALNSIIHCLSEKLMKILALMCRLDLMVKTCRLKLILRKLILLML